MPHFDIGKETISIIIGVFSFHHMKTNMQWEGGVYYVQLLVERGGVSVSQYQVHRNLSWDLRHPFWSSGHQSMQIVPEASLLLLPDLFRTWLFPPHQCHTWGPGNLCKAVEVSASSDGNLPLYSQDSSEQEGAGTLLNILLSKGSLLCKRCSPWMLPKNAQKPFHSHKVCVFLIKYDKRILVSNFTLLH